MWHTINTYVGVVFFNIYLGSRELYWKKVKCLKKELNYISDEKNSDSTKDLLDRLPDYFYTMPASTSGLHHPQFSLGEGGLVRHTKAAVKIAMELFIDKIFNTFEFKEHTQDFLNIAFENNEIVDSADRGQFKTLKR